MITYNTNWMGPTSEWWYQEKFIPFQVVSYINAAGETHTYNKYDFLCSGGRIDVCGMDLEKYYAGRTEIALPTMKDECYNRFSNWLEELETETLWSLEELVARFEEETNSKIIWF